MLGLEYPYAFYCFIFELGRVCTTISVLGCLHYSFTFDALDETLYNNTACMFMLVSNNLGPYANVDLFKSVCVVQRESIARFTCMFG